MDNVCIECGTNEAVVLATCEDGDMIFICEMCLAGIRAEHQTTTYSQT